MRRLLRTTCALGWAVTAAILISVVTNQPTDTAVSKKPPTSPAPWSAPASPTPSVGTVGKFPSRTEKPRRPSA